MGVCRWLVWVLVVGGAGFGCGAGWAQVAVGASGTSTIRVDSRLVVLDVSVTDGGGNAVLDLRRDEFRVYESNQAETVKDFEPPAMHQMPAGAAAKVMVNSSADLPKIGQAPITVLVLDELNMKFEDETYARNELIKWLARQPAVLVQPTCLVAVTYKDFHVVRDYTQDRDALLSTLRKHTVTVPWRKDHDGKTGGAASENMAASMGALEQIAQATRGIPGRKNVIWVGDGFPSVGTADVGLPIADKVNADLRRLSAVMLHARVTLYVIGPVLKAMEPVTIETQADADTALPDSNVGPMQGDIQFAGLALPTGGRAFQNRNDMDNEIGQSVATGGSYYTLSYVPTDVTDNPKKYRRIRVEATRPGLTVQTRDGYYPEAPVRGDAPAPTKDKLAFDLYGAALSTMQYTDLHVRAERVAGDDFAVHVDAGQMTWREMPNGKRHADVILLAVCFSVKQKPLSRTVQTLGSSTDAPLVSIAKVAATLHMKVQVPQGTARIRFVVRDAVSGRVGSADFTP